MLHEEYQARLRSPTKPVSPLTPKKKQESGRSPSKEIYSDRFIPLRTTNLPQNFALLTPSTSPTVTSTKSVSPGVNTTSPATPDKDHQEKLATYNQLLQNELIPPHTQNQSTTPPVSSTRRRLFSWKSTIQESPTSDPFSLSPITPASQILLAAPRKSPRKIPKVPFKVLEAPAIKDDFYLNLVDWSSTNLLAVALNRSVYLWNATSSQVTHLCEISEPDRVTSVAWMAKGTHLAVGASNGTVSLYDVNKLLSVREFKGHQSRVGTLGWSGPLLTSGSRDRSILLRDTRVKEQICSKLVAHKQEVCGLKWSDMLASGGNDNKLLVWDLRSNLSPLCKFTDHKAAVKAIAWSPHQRGLLASGGGTADRCIRFWNCNTNSALQSIDTGSQVCNLAWSKNVNELVSTHGYSQNQIVVWSYPSMSEVAQLTGHTTRVLYLSVSPDGQTIVTGAGDETLRFWNIFPCSKFSLDKPGIQEFYSRNDIR
eukprot:TRINITY_DN8442_c0_g1_i1.p1 TRINITY_DN8442_c0_g1~~TRINITY_DN8442_c0_g1_i1.p1  ORF type:complete len:501 (-),score=67.92 TRINITY_DN8442_c0_g1_i1:119-1564(-)